MTPTVTTTRIVSAAALVLMLCGMIAHAPLTARVTAVIACIIGLILDYAEFQEGH